MQIAISDGGWGEAQTVDIQVLLEDVANQFLQHFENAESGSIVVEASDEGPKVLYRENRLDPYVVLLSARDRLWAKFSYQFAHELCHIAMRYENLQESRNQWFHEALCELSSVFTLRQMANAWQSAPPYQNWSEYAGALSNYAGEIMARPEHDLQPGLSLAGWFSGVEPTLSQDPYCREMNCIVALKLLPLVESVPAYWQSIQFIPNTAAPFDEFLSAWHASCPQKLQGFVAQVAELFEVKCVAA